MSAQFTILEVHLFERPVALRLPFRFGDALVTETGEAHLKVVVHGPNGQTTGQSAQMMVPRWFNKAPNLDNEATIQELRETLRCTARAAIGLTGSIAQLSRALRAIVRDQLPQSSPDLACGFGPAVLEMALIDAACHALGVSFPDAVRQEVFGLSEETWSGLSADQIKSGLAALNAKKTIAVRHTVGYDSPLNTIDVVDRPDDAPVSLDEVILGTGISDFKIKLKGDPDSDVHRLTQIAQVLDGLAGYRATLDANEQYAPADFQMFRAKFKSTQSLERLRAATLFIEQPFPRETALDPGGPVPPNDFPIVIDESDASEDALETALDRGWAGTSVKSCKGVLRALINKIRMEAVQKTGRTAILSAEDLTCQPGLCWQQDTLMAALVGADHVERNGHFHAGGMQGASAKEKADFINAHPKLYQASAAGPQLRITRGRVDISSLNTTGFASGVVPDLSQSKRIDF